MALRAGGIEVWFDRSELRGGDVWDAAIRRQIKSCALFVPIISANTHARTEGYFRLEWKLGIDRSYLIAPDLPFLVPVAIDDTPQSDERIPDRIREVQWTRLPAGETPPAFVQRVIRLLDQGRAPTISADQRLAPGVARRPAAAGGRARMLLPTLAVAIVLLGVGGYAWLHRPAPTSVAAPIAAAARADASASYSPPPHSLAVLPFVNMSEDKSQDYFSDGLSEELLESLARVEGLQVAARTSSFSFKGKDVKIGTVGRELNVAAVLEGSVRRAGNRVRISAQLIDARSGFQLWSATYDRSLGDVLKLQTEIAGAVAGALRVKLLGNAAAKIELGGTHNADALDAFLRGQTLMNTAHDGPTIAAAIAAFDKAVQLDPSYAQAFAGRSFASSGFAEQYAGAEQQPRMRRADADARRALELAPDLAIAHAALARVYEEWKLDLPAAGAQYARALELAPNDAEVLLRAGLYESEVGRVDNSIAMLQRAVGLDPLNPRTQRALGDVLLQAKRYPESVTAYARAIAVDPEAPPRLQAIEHSLRLSGE